MNNKKIDVWNRDDSSIHTYVGITELSALVSNYLYVNGNYIDIHEKCKCLELVDKVKMFVYAESIYSSCIKKIYIDKSNIETFLKKKIIAELDNLCVFVENVDSVVEELMNEKKRSNEGFMKILKRRLYYGE